MLKQEDFEAAKGILSQLEDAKRDRMRIERADRTHVSICGTELRDYEAPSNIGVAFRKVREAILEMIDKQIEAHRGALRALGVDPE